MAGGGSPIARAMGQIDAAKGGSQTQGMPSYQAPSALSQQATGRPQVTSYTPQTNVSPIVQQMAQRIQMQNNPFASGLQSLYSQFNTPQPMPMQMPRYQSPALAYRPDMQQVQQNLGRVRPSVYKTDLDAARQRIAELEAQQQQQQNNDNYWAYNQG